VPHLPDDDQFDNRGAHILASRYRQPGLDVPIDLFTTDESVAATGSNTLGWEQHHGGRLNVHRVGGEHTDPLGSTGVGSLADLIIDALHRARADG
jgi:surfactin synthase thioesterase subunit